MRRYEAEQRIASSSISHTMFFYEYENFTDDFAASRHAEQRSEIETRSRTMPTLSRTGRRSRTSCGPIWSDRPRHPAVGAGRRRDHRPQARAPTRPPSCPHRRPHQVDHSLGRLWRGRSRPAVQLADRTQHHPAAERPCRRDEAARQRRYLGEYPRHQRATKSATWRAPCSCSATHAGARTARRHPDRDRNVARETAQRSDRRDHRPSSSTRWTRCSASVRGAAQRLETTSGRSTRPPTPCPRSRAAPRTASAPHRATSPRPRARSRSSPPRSAKSPLRRNKSTEVAAPRGLGSAPHRHHHVGARPVPRPASAKSSA